MKSCGRGGGNAAADSVYVPPDLIVAVGREPEIAGPMILEYVVAELRDVDELSSKDWVEATLFSVGEPKLSFRLVPKD